MFEIVENGVIIATLENDPRRPVGIAELLILDYPSTLTVAEIKEVATSLEKIRGLVELKLLFSNGHIKSSEYQKKLTTLIKNKKYKESNYADCSTVS